jgi:hypothetical protein
VGVAQVGILLMIVVVAVVELRLSHGGSSVEEK